MSDKLKKTSPSELVESMVNPLGKSTLVKNEGYIEEKDLRLEETAPSEYVSRSSAVKNDVRVIKPYNAVSVPRKTPIPESIKKERARGWEYVEGIAENRYSQDLSITFAMNPYPGDAYATWTIPVGIPISIPRWLAIHLNTRLESEYGFKPRKDVELQVGDVMENFDIVKSTRRTSFMKVADYS